MSKNLYGVTLPVSGYLYLEVRANSKKEAIEAAMADGDNWPTTPDEWQTHRDMVSGNVCHAQVRHASAEIIEEGDEE